MELMLVPDKNDTEVSINHALELKKALSQGDLLRRDGLSHTRILRDEAIIKRCVSFLKS